LDFAFRPIFVAYLDELDRFIAREISRSWKTPTNNRRFSSDHRREVARTDFR